MDTQLEGLLEPDQLDSVERMRHSAAHVMAHAIQNLFPGTQFGIGPTIENGFYYDIKLPQGQVLTPEHLPQIESEMRKLVDLNATFVRKEYSVQEALVIFRKMDQPFKVEIIENLRDRVGATSVSAYQEGDFIDLCRGPHVKSAGELGAFKLTHLAGAYWRGSEKNPQLTRIYGLAFETQSELDEHLRLLEEAKKRDHRKLGKDLDLFSFHPEAPSSPFFHPKGAVVYNRLVEFIRTLYGPYEYEEIITPQILDVALWKTSGHYDNYKENMYFTEVDERQFAVKPMNCPASTFVFASQKRSYRDLPLRLADFGRLHRYERSGVTAGLTRVRSFCQDDAHVFCTPEQIEDEIRQITQMILGTYELFGFQNLKIYLSTRPEKRVGSDTLWDQAESGLKRALEQLKIAYVENPGDGAFYGPKIDFNVQDALKRYHQLGTVQLDFNLAERFGLQYTGADNAPHTPVVLHRAVLGSIERFMGILIEHTAGVLPFWLAPIQARLIPIKDTHQGYARDFLKTLRRLGIRVDIDARNESMGLKTREAQTSKIPFSLVAGDREVAQNQFALRKYGEKESKVMTQDEIIAYLKALDDEPLKAVVERP